MPVSKTFLIHVKSHPLILKVIDFFDNLMKLHEARVCRLVWLLVYRAHVSDALQQLCLFCLIKEAL